MSLMVRDALGMAAGRFEQTGSLSPKKDAELLLLYMLHVDSAWLFTHYSDHLDDRQCDMFFELMDRRAACTVHNRYPGIYGAEFSRYSRCSDPQTGYGNFGGDRHQRTSRKKNALRRF